MNHTLLLNAFICITVLIALHLTNNPLCIFCLILLKDLPYDLDAHKAQLEAGVSDEENEEANPIGFVH